VILLTSYSGTGKIVVILSLFSSGSMYEKKVSESFMRPLSKLVVVTPQECFYFQSLAFPGLSCLSHFSRRGWE